MFSITFTTLVPSFFQEIQKLNPSRYCACKSFQLRPRSRCNKRTCHMVSTVLTCVRKLLTAFLLQRHVCLYVRPFVLLSLHMEQLGSKCTDFREILYFFIGWNLSTKFNILAPELFFFILAHSVNKMRIIQEPNKLELWNKLYFKEKKKKTESIHHV